MFPAPVKLIPFGGGGGCDTNPYKASIMEREVATRDADDIQSGRRLTPLDPGVLLCLINSSFTALLSHRAQQTWLKEKKDFRLWTDATRRENIQRV